MTHKINIKPELLEPELDEPTKEALRQIEKDFVEAMAASSDPEKRQDAWKARIKALKALLGEESEE